ncbi:uncharacterized protein LOC112055702 [Bicyclus anynana]|uniref:Uncharacterized protein LOC112055702 n=1 Tax=Bicyclus anynana TaxID=110368 RepID=A0A6J1P3U3_BICAN|nr:uncharacterized protein LOC112055702 [Bicyclus anynana]
MSHAFYADAWGRAARRQRNWYMENLMPALLNAKEKQAREIDAMIEQAQELLGIYKEPLDKAVPVPPRVLEPWADDSLMKPIEPEVLNLLYGATEKGAAERYLKARNKKSPDDKYVFRAVTSWDYGWQQKQSRVRARDVNRGRCAILRDTFYRKNNLGPDPRHYSIPAGGEVSICNEYSCDAS